MYIPSHYHNPIALGTNKLPSLQMAYISNPSRYRKVTAIPASVNLYSNTKSMHCHASHVSTPGAPYIQEVVLPSPCLSLEPLLRYLAPDQHPTLAGGDSASHALQRFLQSCSGDYASDGILSAPLRGERRHDKEVLKVNEVPLTRIGAGLTLPTHHVCADAVQPRCLLTSCCFGRWHLSPSFRYAASCLASQLISAGNCRSIRPAGNKSSLMKHPPGSLVSIGDFFFFIAEMC